MVRKIISVIEIWPLDAAYRSGVHPEKSFGFLFWLLSKNNWQIAVWPFKAATWSGVWPFLPFGFLSWTFLIINLHKDKCPFLAAQCNKVSPDSKKFLGFLSGRCSMINRQIGRSPFLAALYEPISINFWLSLIFLNNYLICRAHFTARHFSLYFLYKIS